MAVPVAGRTPSLLHLVTHAYESRFIAAAWTLLRIAGPGIPAHPDLPVEPVCFLAGCLYSDVAADAEDEGELEEAVAQYSVAAGQFSLS